MTRYFYEARLVPIGKPVSIPDEEAGRASVCEFHDKSFEIERTSKTKPEIWIDHDRDLRIGNVVMLYTSRDWWMCDFFLNRDLPDDIVSRSGSPCRSAFSFLKIGSGAPYLREVSIVRRGAVEGAEITSRSELKPPKPAPVKPAATTTPRSRPLSPVAAAPPVVYRTPKANRDIIETAELRRRHDWLLDNGYRVSFEEVLDNLKSEVGYGRDLGLEWHNKHRRSA